MHLATLLDQLGNEITDIDEETFLLFSQVRPSHNLGFLDSKAKTLNVAVANRDLFIIQSPGLLSSNRDDGTTGAVLWQITPLLAEWLSAEGNLLFDSKVLHRQANVIELGCGSSGILALTLGTRVGRFVATDQEYVFKLLRQNLEANTCAGSTRADRSRRQTGKFSRVNESKSSPGNVSVLALDWEKDSVASFPSTLELDNGFDLVLACDCIYNEALIAPFVDACANLCRLRQDAERPTVCLIAQQLRSDEVFTAWLAAFSESFQIWRIPDSTCGSGLSTKDGFAIHLGVLKSCGTKV